MVMTWINRRINASALILKVLDGNDAFSSSLPHVSASQSRTDGGLLSIIISNDGDDGAEDPTCKTRAFPASAGKQSPEGVIIMVVEEPKLLNGTQYCRCFVIR